MLQLLSPLDAEEMKVFTYSVYLDNLAYIRSLEVNVVCILKSVTTHYSSIASILQKKNF